jgi:hypothetical protein
MNGRPVLALREACYTGKAMELALCYHSPGQDCMGIRFGKGITNPFNQRDFTGRRRKSSKKGKDFVTIEILNLETYILDEIERLIV